MYKENQIITIKNKLESYEVYILISVLIISIYVLIISNHWISWYISLEIFSFLSIFFLLIGSKFSHSNLSFICFFYFLLNSLSSILILLSILYIYNQKGNLEIIGWIYNIENIKDKDLGIRYDEWILIGIMIKLGAAPFHFWVLTLYDSANTRITFFLITIPKLIYGFLLIKFLPFIFNLQLFMIFILSSLFFGSILGLQNLHLNSSIKKLLAASSISSVGYFLWAIICYSNNINNIPLLSYSNNYINNPIFYIILYTMNLILIFSILLLFKDLNHINKLKSIREFAPWFSIPIVFSIFSFIGLPPLTGFYAKFLLILNSFYLSPSYSILFILALIFSSVVSCNFYLYFLKFIYNNQFFPFFYQSFFLNLSSSYSVFLSSLFFILLISYPLYSTFFYSILSLFIL